MHLIISHEEEFLKYLNQIGGVEEDDSHNEVDALVNKITVKTQIC